MDRDLNSVLTPAQVEVVRTFTPCTIPPRELKDPVRVGQASNELDDVLQELDHLRRLPRVAADQVIPPLVRDRLEPWAALTTSSQRDGEEARLKTILRRACAMEETDYAVSREDLARELTRGRREFEAKEKEIAAHYEDVYGGLSRTAQFLLNPRVADLLEEKLRRAEKSLSRSNDPTADSCKKASCAEDALPTEEATHCRCGAPRTAYVYRLLSVSPEHREIVRRIVREARTTAYAALAREREDGRNIVYELYSGSRPWEEIVALRVPGGDITYEELLNRIAEDRDRRLARRFARPRMEIWYEKAPGVLDVED